MLTTKLKLCWCAKVGKIKSYEFIYFVKICPICIYLLTYTFFEYIDFKAQIYNRHNINKNINIIQ